MNIVYTATVCSNSVYQDLFSESKIKPAAPAQKYHRLLIEGLAANTKVDVVANPPVLRSILEKPWKVLPEEQVGNACYHHLPAIRNPILKQFYITLASFWKTFKLLKKDSAVVLDCLNRTISLSAVLAAKLKGCRCVAIVTDLPDILQENNLVVKLTYFILRHSTDYVLMTEPMNERVNPTNKPYVVLEGHSDISLADCEVSLEKKASPRVCMYAGDISKLYDLDKLVEGFRKANIPNTRLELYGYCDFTEELNQISQEDPRVFYGGVRLNSEIVEREQAASLLVNPWPTKKEYVKEFLTYSFPSKNMEYMASGTPVLTTVLPGMPKEYYPYVYLLEEETADGIANALTEIFAQGDELMLEKGKAAKKFVMETRNNVVQAAKILEMLKNEG